VQSTSPTRVATRAWLRPLYLAAGVLFLVVAVVGLYLPLIPTTGPLLLAAFFFARSSERLYTWLISHPRFGGFIRDFQEGKGIPLRVQVVAITAMTVSFTVTLVWLLDHLVARIAVGAIAVFAIWYVARLPRSDRPG
jgi:uncharacterized membrane protein YbaN (DUF454 family)